MKLKTPIRQEGVQSIKAGKDDAGNERIPALWRESFLPTLQLRGGLVTDKVVIMVTAASRRECRKIARRLIEGKLAACVNITQPIQSVYWWEGKIDHSKEFLMFIKSRRDLFPQIKAEIDLIHSYHTPEIICLPIIDGSPNYLQWVGDSVRPAEKAEVPQEQSPT